VPVILDQRAGISVVSLDGDVDIRAATELKDILLAALLTRQELRVELAGLTTLDITILQLLWAARLAAARSDTKLILAGPVSEGAKQAMDLASMPPVDLE
jgi:anti-anti-sigma regulatory factor